MKLITLEILAFGKLKNFTLTPEAGLNTYIQPNEFGKTTLIHFIYFMLYGYEAKRLKTYLPWSGEAMAGSLTMEMDGRIWKIERTHPHKGAEKRQVFCTTSGENAPLSAKEQPGPYFLKLDGETFLRTFCITQGDLLFARTDGLDTALKNMAATGDESVSFVQAEEFLNNEHTRYKHRGKERGNLPDLQREVEQDKQRLLLVRRGVDEQLALKEEWSQLDRQLQELDRQIQQENQNLQKALAGDAIKTLEKLEKFRRQDQKSLTPPRVSLQDLTVLEEAFARTENARRQQEDAEQAERAALARGELLQNSMDAFGFHAMTPRQVQSLQQKRTGLTVVAILLALVGLGGLLLALFGTGAALRTIAGSLGGGMLLLALILPLSEHWRKRRICLMNGAATPQQLLEKWARFAAIKQQKDQLDPEKQQIAQQVAQARQEVAQATAALEQLQRTHRVLSMEELQDLRVEWGVYEQNKNRKPSLLTEQEILGDQTEEQLRLLAAGGTPTDDTAARVRQRIALLQEQARQVQRQKDELDIRDLAALWEEQQQLEQTIAQKEQQAEQWQKNLAAVLQSLDWLRAANEEMNTRFAPQLCKTAGAYLAALTEGRYTGLLLNDNYEILVSAPEGTYPLSAFSAGTRDGVYFAFRLAVGQLLSETVLPMVLDDPFVNLDPQRKEAAMALLEQAGKNHQILYFSCRP